MAQAPGALSPPLFNIIGGALYFSVDNGATWTKYIGGAGGVSTVTAGAGGGINIADPANPIVIGAPAMVSTVTGSAAQDITSAAVTGDSDGGYYIESNVSMLTPSGVATLTLQFNGATPDLSWSSGVYSFASSAPANWGAAQTLQLGANPVSNQATNFSIRAWVGSKQGAWQAFSAVSVQQRLSSPSAAAFNVVFMGGQFKMASQITSIGVHCSQASLIDIGSTLSVAKRGFQ